MQNMKKDILLPVLRFNNPENVRRLSDGERAKSMNSLHEIKMQSRFDSFVKMYGCIAEAIIAAGGNKGERAVREAVIRYGREKGEILRQAVLESGKSANLRTILYQEQCCGEDPRFFRKTIKDTEEVQMFEVYSCPMEYIWRKNGWSRAGSIYCEEYIHALIKAYTQGKGQANLSNHMTCDRDFFCRFSLYLRPANLDELQKKECFEGTPAEEQRLKGRDTEKERKKESENFLCLYHHLYWGAKEYLGLDGMSAVSKGLDKLYTDLKDALRKKAEHTGEEVSAEFLEKYFPLPLQIADEENNKEEDQLLEIHLTRRLFRELAQKKN